MGTFRYDEIGQRLRAFRLASGLSADEIRKRIGISRTALYRFEKGELVKIETLEKLAELLDVSIPTLLGVGIEYLPSAVAYFERMRQIEETAEHIVVLAGPISFLLASETFEATLESVLVESISDDVLDRKRALADVPKIMDILHARKETYRKRKPTIVNLISVTEVARFLDHGFIGRTGVAPEVLAERRGIARAEIEHFLHIINEEPIGIQVGLVTESLPFTGFQIFRQPERKILSVSPFRLGEQPNVRVGVAMMTSAPEALMLHEKTVSDMWRRAHKGAAAASYLEKLLAQANSFERTAAKNGRSKPAAAK